MMCGNPELVVKKQPLAAILENAAFCDFPPKIERDMGAHFKDQHLKYLKPPRN